MASKEIVLALRLSEGTTREQFRALKGALIDVREEITQNNKALRDNAKEQRTLDAALKEGAVTIEQAAVKSQALLTARELLKTESANLASQEASLSHVYREAKNDVGGLTDAGLRFRDKMAQATIEALKQEGVLGKLGARMDFLRAEQERLNAEQKEGKITQDQYTKSAEKLANEERELGVQMSGLNAKVDALTKEFQQGKITQDEFRRGIDGINTSVAGVGASIRAGVQDLKGYALGFFGVVAVAQGAISVLKNIGKTVTDFQQSNTNLAAILGTTRDRIGELTDSAIKIGPAFGRAPEAVTELQTELAKLGFTVPEILAAQEAVITLANATGETLGKSAEVAAATLNGFNLSATETGRVVDVIAQAANSSSLDLEKFSVAMATVAPAANQAGFSIEETTALIGVLSDRGLDASSAGTALRSMFIDLAKTGQTFDEAMAEINSSTNKTGTAFDLFGERAAGAAVILAEAGDETNNLTEALNNAGGAAAKVASEQLNTISGSVAKLGASWDAMVLSIDQGDGVISGAVRGILDGITSLIAPTQKQSDAVAGLGVEFDSMFGVLKNGNLTEAERAELIDRINAGYAEYLPTLIKATDGEEALSYAQEVGNENIRKRIILLAQQEIAQDAQNDAIEERKDAIQAELDYQRALDGNATAFEEVTAKALGFGSAVNYFGSLLAAQRGQANDAQNALDGLTKAMGGVDAAQKRVAESSADITTASGRQKASLEELQAELVRETNLRNALMMVRPELGAPHDKIIAALNEEIAKKKEQATVDAEASASSLESAKTVGGAIEDLNAKLAKAREDRLKLTAANTDGIKSADAEIAGIEKQIRALEGKGAAEESGTKKTKDQTEAEREKISVTQELTKAEEERTRAQLIAAQTKVQREADPTITEPQAVAEATAIVDSTARLAKIKGDADLERAIAEQLASDLAAIRAKSAVDQVAAQDRANTDLRARNIALAQNELNALQERQEQELSQTTLKGEALAALIQQQADEQAALKLRIEDGLIEAQLEKFDAEYQAAVLNGEDILTLTATQQEELAALRASFGQAELDRQVSQLEAEQAMQDAKIASVAGFGQALRSLAKEGSAAAKIGLALEKAAAIASIIVNTQRANAVIQGFYPIGTPLTPAALTAIAANKIQAAVSIATILATTIAGFAEGGEVGGGNGTIRKSWGKPIRRKNGDNVLITAREGEKILNEEQQEELERQHGRDVWKRIGLPGAHHGGRTRSSFLEVNGYATGGQVTTAGISTFNIAGADVNTLNAIEQVAEQRAFDMKVVASIEEIESVSARRASIIEMSRG